MNTKATERQVRYALILLKEAGYSTKWMNADFKNLGASMRERSGSVTGWLEGMDVGTISSLIDRLKKPQQGCRD